MRYRIPAVIAGAAALLVLTATPALAHVTVDPSIATKGSDAVLTFNVPNEMDNANTTQVQIVFPTDHPIAAADVQPVAGWTAKVDTTHVSTPIKTDQGSVSEAVSQVTWSGGAIMPGQFERFTISVGLPDDASSLEFKALQTYSNGQVVRWIEDTPKGGPEPDHPAPVLTLVSATGSASTASAKLPTDLAKKSDVDSAKTLGIVGIVVGGIGLVLGAVALVSRRRAHA